MKNILILSSIFLALNFQLNAQASVNQDQEVAADNYCLVYGCGDQPPMDDL